MQSLRTSSLDIETTQCSRDSFALDEPDTCILVKAPPRLLASPLASPLGMPRIRRIRAVNPPAPTPKTKPTAPRAASPAPAPRAPVQSPLPRAPAAPAPPRAAESGVVATASSTAAPIAPIAPITPVVARGEPKAGSMFLFLAGFAMGLALCMLFATMRGRSSAQVRYDVCSAVASAAGFRCTGK